MKKKKNIFLGLLIVTVLLLTIGCPTTVEPAPSEPMPTAVTYDAGTGNTSGTVPVDATAYASGATVTVLDNTGNLVGANIGSDIKQRFIGWHTDSGATTALYTAGNTFNITENTTLYAIYTTGTDVLRKVGPAGGLIFYDAGSTQSWGRYLEAAPQSTEWTSKEWGKYGTLVSGTETAIGTGKNNTALIVATLNETPAETDRAAQLADALSYGGKDDWFLPSKDELNEMCWVLHSRRYVGGVENNPEYGTNRVGGFAGGTYWSSSEYNSFNAWFQSFVDGDQTNDYKLIIIRVRAVRAF